MSETQPPKTSVAKIVGIITVVGSLYAFGGHLYNDYQSNLQKIREAAAKEALTDLDRMNYRANMRLFQDSVRKAINKLDQKNHIEKTFQ